MKCIKCKDGELMKDDHGDMFCKDCGQDIDDYHIDLYTAKIHYEDKVQKLREALECINKISTESIHSNCEENHWELMDIKDIAKQALDNNSNQEKGMSTIKEIERQIGEVIHNTCNVIGCKNCPYDECEESRLTDLLYIWEGKD